MHFYRDVLGWAPIPTGSGRLPFPADTPVAMIQAQLNDQPTPAREQRGMRMIPPGAAVAPAAPGGAESAERKDTLRNVEETGEFVINIVSEAIADAANATSAEVAFGVDEFALSGLTRIPSEAVRPPRVAESPAQMECKLLQVIYTGHEARSGVIVLGEILRFHLREDLFDNFRVDPAKLAAVGRMAGNTWTRTRDLIELIRPK